jgi:hypothetical protein
LTLLRIELEIHLLKFQSQVSKKQTFSTHGTRWDCPLCVNCFVFPFCFLRFFSELAAPSCPP